MHLLYKGLSEAFGIDIVRSLLEKAKQSSGEDKVRYALNALVLAEIIGKLDLRDEAFQLICEGENEKRRKLQEELQQQQREI